MFGAAVDQLGKAGGSVISGLGDVYNAKTQQLGSIGASLTGNREEATKLAEEAQKNEFRSQTKFSGAAGNVIGAAGSGLMGALGIAAAPVVGTGYGAANSILDVADVAGQVVGAPGIKKTVTDAASNVGKGIMGGLKTAGDVVNTGAEGTIGLARNPLTGQEYGFSDEEKKSLGQEALAATNLIGATTSGVGTAIAKNTISSLGKTGIGKMAQKLTSEAGVLAKAKVGATGNWISQLGSELGGMAYRVNALSKGVDIPLNADVKSLARAYTAERVQSFMSNPAVRMAGAAAQKVAPVAKLHPAYWGTKLAVGTVKREYNIGVHAYNAIAKTYGLPTAQKIVDMNDPTTRKMQNAALAAKDMRPTAQRVKATAAVYASQVGEVTESVKKNMETVFSAIEDMPSVKGVGKQFVSRLEVMDTAISEMSNKGMGANSAVVENTKAFLRNTAGYVENGMTTASGGFQKIIKQLTDQITSSDTIDGLKAVSQKLTNLLKGEGIDPADLATNRRFLAQMKKTVSDDITETLGMYSPETAELLADAAKNTDAQALNLAERIQSMVGDAGTEQEKINVLRREFFDAAKGLDEAEAALLMTKLQEFAGDFFDNGAVAFREAVKETPLEGMYGKESMYKAAQPDDAISLENAEWEYNSYIEKQPITERVGEFVSRVRDRFRDKSAVSQALLDSFSDGAFKTMANNIEIDESVLKRSLSGDGKLMGTKQGMTEISLENLGKGAADVLPQDKIGEKLVKERATLIYESRKILGKDLEQKLKENRFTEVDITAALFGSDDAPGLYTTIKDEFGAYVNVATGEWEIPKDSLLGVMVKDRNKAATILGQLEKSITLTDGRAVAPLKKLDDLQTILDSLPGQLELSDAGEFRRAFDDVIGHFRENVLAAYPETIRDAQAAYARASDAWRGILSGLGGIDEKTFNKRTVWLPNTAEDSIKDRVLIDTVAKTVGKNLSRLNGANAERIDAYLTEVFSILEKTPEGVWSARDEIYNLVEFNNLLAELGGVPRTNMMGNASRFAGGFGPDETVVGTAFNQYKNHGLMRAVTGLLSVERKDTEKLNMLYNLVRNQAERLKVDPSKAYFAPTIFQKNPIDMARYEDWEKPNRITIEDTAQSPGYGEDIGMKDVVLDSPSQTLPDVGNDAFEIPDEDLPF